MNDESLRSRLPLTGDDIAELRQEFEACDRDADGRVTPVEFDGLLESLGSQLSAAQRHAEFSRIDVDGNGLINLGEFSSWWQGC